MTAIPPPSNEPRGADPQSSTVRALAMLGVVFGTLGLSCLPFNFGTWITYGSPIAGARTTPIDMWVFASTFIGIGLSVLLLLSSLGAFHFRKWGRIGMLAWSEVSLLYGIVGIFLYGRFLLPWLRGEYANIRGPDTIAGLLAWMIGSCLAVFVLYDLTRPSVRELFDLSEQPHDSNPA